MSSASKSSHAIKFLVTLVTLSTSLVVGTRLNAWTQPVTPGAHEGKLAVGLDFSCVVEGDDTVKCWGANDSYKTGQSSGGPVSAPTTVAVGASSMVTAGANHACALSITGVVWCWGSNTSGQSGPVNVGSASPTPQQVSLSGPATSIAAGADHTCAVLASNAVQCWGANSYGQLGDGTTASSSTAVTVAGVAASMVTAGSRHTCALKSDDTVWCWGQNSDGELGDGTTTDSSTPVLAQGLTGVTLIDAGSFATCAVANGKAWCWGSNSDGELGSGSAAGSATPTEVSSLAGVASLSIGEGVACFVTTTPALYCSGSNSTGQLGSPMSGTTTSPVLVSSFSSTPSVVQAGTRHVCALSADGKLFCWGDNSVGQVGIGSLTHSFAPYDIWGSDAPTGISAGYENSCQVRAANVFCWGDNSYGQLGVGTTADVTDRFSAAAVFTTSDATAVATNSRSTCASRTDGTLWCWGLNNRGQLGDNTTTSPRTSPVQATVSNVGSFSVGSTHTCAVNTFSMTAACWGFGYNGRLGNNSTSNSSGAVSVVGVGGTGTLTGLSQVALGQSHSCALASGGPSAGRVFCWGFGGNGQMGNGTTTTTNTSPVAVSSITTATAIAAGSSHTCALLSAGSVFCWGDNTLGQLGDGTKTLRSTPIQMQLSNTAVALAAGGDVTCALLSDGGVECAGANDYGTLGTDTTLASSVPLAITVPSGYTVTELSVSASHVCARATNPDVKVLCWGANFKGSLGVDPDILQTSAREVRGYTAPATTTTAPTTTPPTTTSPEATTTTPATTAPPTTAPPTTSAPTPKLTATCTSSSKGKITCKATRPSGLSGKVKYRLTCRYASTTRTASVSSSAKKPTVTLTRLKSGKTQSCTLSALVSSVVRAEKTFQKKPR